MTLTDYPDVLSTPVPRPDERQVRDEIRRSSDATIGQHGQVIQAVGRIIQDVADQWFGRNRRLTEADVAGHCHRNLAGAQRP